MTTPTASVETTTLASLAGADVLVTGGAGFVGSWIADALTDVCDVTVLDDLTAGRAAAVPADAELVRGDVRDPETVEQTVSEADVVFHQAGMTDVGRSVRAPFESHTRNATGTMAVLEAARRADARVVFASSAAVYGHPESLPVHERDRKTPTSPYGIAKLAADQYVRAYADLYDLPTVALRYFNVYGPDRRDDASDVVSAFLRRARRGDPLVLYGDGTQTRDFVHVADVVQANVRAAVTDGVGRAYNVGTGTGTAVQEVADRVVSLTDTGSEVVREAPRPGDVEHSRADIGRAEDGLGYEPTVGLDDGLADIVGRQPTERESATD